MNFEMIFIFFCHLQLWSSGKKLRGKNETKVIQKRRQSVDKWTKREVKVRQRNTNEKTKTLCVRECVSERGYIVFM